MNIIEPLLPIIYTSFAAINLITFVVFAVISFQEKQERAAWIFLASSLLTSLPFLAFLLGFDYISLTLIVIELASLILLLSPIQHPTIFKTQISGDRFDERDIMFSRNELKEGDSRYEEYYESKKDRKIIDDKIRSNPGLMSKDSSFYHRYAFTATESTYLW